MEDTQHLMQKEKSAAGKKVEHYRTTEAGENTELQL
jgi:hypothetical protein